MPIYSSTAEKNENPTPVQDHRCLSGLSARKSVIFGEEILQRIMGQTNNDCRLDEFTTPATFAYWKIRFESEVCTCSQFPAEAMPWIKEVEMVDSVDDLQSSSSVSGIRMPEFEATRCEDCFSAQQNHP